MYGRVLSFLIRYFSNYYTLHRSDLAARAAPLDPRLNGTQKGTMRTNSVDAPPRGTHIHSYMTFRCRYAEPKTDSKACS